VSMPAATLASQPSLRPAQSADVRVAASTRTGPPRRAWQAAMALPYCGGPPCWPQPSLGGGSILLPWGWPNGGQGAWGSGRQRPAAGAHAGKTCIPRPPQPCGRWPKRTDHQPPPCVPPWPLRACQRQRLAMPCAPPGRGRRRTVGQAQAHQKLPAPEALCDKLANTTRKRRQRRGTHGCASLGKRPCLLAMAPAGGARGARTRPALTLWGGKHKPSPGGVGRQRGATAPSPGSSSATLSDGIVEAREAWWTAWDAPEPGSMARRQRTRDTGPASRGRRPPLLQRLIHPIVALSRKVSQHGVTLRKRAMRTVENRLTRHPEWPHGDMLMQPVSTSC
jgi:hypothetical protein